jgi:hypothetical protein
MNEFRIVWQQCPHVQHVSQVLFIEAPNAEDARAVAQDHIERTHRIEWFTIRSIEPYVRPTAGRVVQP